MVIPANHVRIAAEKVLTKDTEGGTSFLSEEQHAVPRLPVADAEIQLLSRGKGDGCWQKESKTHQRK